MKIVHGQTYLLKNIFETVVIIGLDVFLLVDSIFAVRPLGLGTGRF